MSQRTMLASLAALSALGWFIACGADNGVGELGNGDGGDLDALDAGAGTSTPGSSLTGGLAGAPGGGVVGTGPGASGPTGGGGISGSAGSGGSAAGGTGAPNGGGTGGAPPDFGPCKPGGSQCNDCIDNDGDGKTDYFDPECTGPLDNDERTFATGIPGDNKDDEKSCKQDCFFDGNSGGDEGCQHDLRCDPLRKNTGKCSYSANASCGPQSNSCIAKCRAVTPNGCDCFGCCLIPGVAQAIKLSATCTAAAANDPTKCQPCTQVPSCLNTCEKCEVCLGKTTLDPSCTPSNPGTGGASGGTGGASGGTGGASGTGGTQGGTGGSPPPPPPQCAGGLVSCGPGGVAPWQCPAGTYCVTGCCVAPIN